ncbi:MAG: hypothetical protein KY432_06820, partial [Acidobacteria bacterium]|nr:hypothetical protein [Acidobacteriota bacterium]
VTSDSPFRESSRKRDSRWRCTHFPPACPDPVWLEEVGKRGWIALTHDQRIRYKQNERAAVIDHRVILLVLVGKARFPELAESFVSTYDRIQRFLQDREPPMIAKIYRPTPSELQRNPKAPGRVEQWYPQ